jgi:hypothetical protein
VIGGWFLAGGLFMVVTSGNPAAAVVGLVGALLWIACWWFLCRLAHEARLHGDGAVEFVHLLGTRRVAASDIWIIKRGMVKVGVEDQDPRELRIEHRRGTNRLPYFPGMEQFIKDVQVRNPRVAVEGQWPTGEEAEPRLTSGDGGSGERRHTDHRWLG